MSSGYSFVLPRAEALELGWALECLASPGKPELGPPAREAVKRALASAAKNGIAQRPSGNPFPAKRRHVRLHAPDLDTLHGFWLGLDWFARGLPAQRNKPRRMIEALMEAMDKQLTEHDPIARLASLARTIDLTPPHDGSGLG